MMINTFFRSSINNPFVYLKNTTASLLNSSEKKIAALVIVIFSGLTALYLIRRFYFNQKSIQPLVPVKKPLVPGKLSEQEKPYFKAMDLMFSNRTLANHGAILTFSPEEVEARHQAAIQAIKDIPNEEISCTHTYRDGMAYRITTLLLHAIQKIKNRLHRLEIVQLLLERGANPLGKGEYHFDNDDAITCAKKENPQDPELIHMLTKGIPPKGTSEC